MKKRRDVQGWRDMDKRQVGREKKEEKDMVKEEKYEMGVNRKYKRLRAEEIKNDTRRARKLIDKER